jgi:glycosyltransferase involved in cell wall biosynthesis
MFTRVGRVWSYSIALRGNYDAVFVHMNEEYVLLAGLVWKLMGKRVYLWRNHYAGSWRTRLAGALATKVFYTSPDSYTASFKNAVSMPVGIDTELFRPGMAPKRGTALSLGRIAPSKRLEIFVDAMRECSDLTGDIYGEALPKNRAYREKLQTSAPANVAFYGGVPPAETPALYDSHKYFVNCSPDGMFDKTIFEALAAGALAVSSNRNLRDAIDPRLSFDGTVAGLVQTLRRLENLSASDTEALRQEGRSYVETTHSLRVWRDRLLQEMA